MRRPILFPIETINRELDYRLALAVLTATPERRIYIGQHARLHRLVREFRGGVYVGKNVMRSSPPKVGSEYRLLKSQGFSVVYLHEEGAVFKGQESDWRSKLETTYDPTLFADDDLICEWGRFQAEHDAKRAPERSPQLRVTGHPRFDLHKPEMHSYFDEDARRLANRFGRFVMVDTNFARANHGLGPAPRFYGSTEGLSEQFKADLDAWAYAARAMADMVHLVWVLSRAFPQLVFVVRPHPSEDWGHYRRVFRGADNVVVAHEGPASPWLLAAEAVIHNGCTTGIEARFGGTPVLSFDSPVDRRHSSHLPNAVGAPIESIDQAVHRLHSLLGNADAFDWPDVTERERQLLHNFEGDAFLEVSKAIDEAETNIKGQPHDPGLLQLGGRQWTRQAGMMAKRPVSWIHPAKRSKLRYSRNKFYGLSRSIVDSKLAVLQEQFGRTIQRHYLSSELIAIDG